METTAILLFLRQSIHVIPLFLLTAGCIVLLVRARSRAAVMMLAGNLLLIAAAAVQGVLTVMMISGGMNHEVYGQFALVLQILALAGGVTFGVGFLIMAFSVAPRVPGKRPDPTGPVHGS
jgi:hypothetical protein